LSLKQDVTPEGGGGGGGGPAKSTRKRKPEVAMDLDIPETGSLTTPGDNKSKRRKDK